MSKRQKPTEDISKVLIDNQIYMNEIRGINDQKEELTGKSKKHFILTYGCQMNEHDSEKLDAMLRMMGYHPAISKADADLVIINTCCVRENAEFKVFGNLGQLKTLKAKNKDMIIAVCGCMMQQPHVVDAIKTKYRHVDLVFGTHNLHHFPRMLADAMKSDTTMIEIWKEEGSIIEGLPVTRKIGMKAYVNIMYGCNNFCTYCIVPYTRGRERSRQPEDILSEIQQLILEGVKEFTLLGQNVNSYGKDLEIPLSFETLLKQVDGLDGMERIRFMTSHPKDFDKHLINTIVQSKHICDHIHLPIQAASNRLLKAMNRYYTKEEYLDLIHYIRKELPTASITTDVIIGFPGETEEDIQELIELAKEVRYDSAYTFIYSLRTGTPAAEMDNQIQDDLKHQRFDRVLKVMNDIVKEKNMAMKNQVVQVLVEGLSREGGNSLSGRTTNNRVVNFHGSPDLIGKIVTVKVTHPRNFSLSGEMI